MQNAIPTYRVLDAVIGPDAGPAHFRLATVGTAIPGVGSIASLSRLNDVVPALGTTAHFRGEAFATSKATILTWRITDFARVDDHVAAYKHLRVTGIGSRAGAGEERFLGASCRATVSADSVAVVALLIQDKGGVAANGGATGRRATKSELHGAGGGASVPVFRRHLTVIAGLVRRAIPITALKGDASLASYRTEEAIFELARAIAPVTVVGSLLPVVTLLATLALAIATHGHGNTFLSGARALIAIFHRRTVCGTTVVAGLSTVIADFVPFKNAIATNDSIFAGLPRLQTNVVWVLLGTVSGTTVAVLGVPIVADF